MSDTPITAPQRGDEAAADAAPEAVETQDVTAPQQLVEADLLVEDVSIDGMCGVY